MPVKTVDVIVINNKGSALMCEYIVITSAIHVADPPDAMIN